MRHEKVCSCGCLIFFAKLPSDRFVCLEAKALPLAPDSHYTLDFQGIARHIESGPYKVHICPNRKE